MQGKLLRQALDKFMKGEVAQNARVQVILPNGIVTGKQSNVLIYHQTTPTD